MRTAGGIVYLVGAGPGDPELITVRGATLLSEADVILHDRLISPELLTRARDGAELINAGKRCGRFGLSQDRINALLIEHASRGRCVVRLKGGDPFVLGRGYEELCACRDAGIDCVVVPGVSSAIAVPAMAGIPVTLRGVARSFAVLTATTAAGETERGHDFGALAAIDTLIVLMGHSNLPDFIEALMAAGRSSTTPTACIEQGTTAQQRVTVATLSEIVEAVRRDGLSAPMTTVIGDVAAEATRSVVAIQEALAG